MLLWAMCTELVKIYSERAFTGTRSARILWIALACLIGALVVAGLFATFPHTAAIGVIVACWATFLFTVVVVWIDASERAKEVPVEIPAALSLSDVVSWRKPAATTMQGTNGRSNTA